jgi:hypothetical protein
VLSQQPGIGQLRRTGPEKRPGPEADRRKQTRARKQTGGSRPRPGSRPAETRGPKADPAGSRPGRKRPGPEADPGGSGPGREADLGGKQTWAEIGARREAGRRGRGVPAKHGGWVSRTVDAAGARRATERVGRGPGAGRAGLDGQSIPPHAGPPKTGTGRNWLRTTRQREIPEKGPKNRDIT